MIPIHKLKAHVDNYYVGDIETLLVDNIHTPYAIAFYNNKHFIHINYANPQNFKQSSDDLIGEAFLNLAKHRIRVKNNTISEAGDKIILFHNLSRFDGIFIMRGMFQSGINMLQTWIDEITCDSRYSKKYFVLVDPLIRDNLIYQIEIKLSVVEKDIEKKDQTFVIFRIIDSYLILPKSLNSLGKSFLNDSKISFNHESVSVDWLKNKSNRESSEAYLIKDVKLLYNIIKVARKEFINLFEIDILNHLTLPGVSLTLYRYKYLPYYCNILFRDRRPYDLNHTIDPITSRAQEEYIRSAYVGGRVDVFKPYFCKGESDDEMNHYDINSLYPFAMTQSFPVGQPKFITTCSINDIYNHIGFFRCEVIVPRGIKIPILPKRIVVNGHSSLIFPVGTMEGIWFGEELRMAHELGYKITVLSAWVYPREKPIFKDYIAEIYKNRLEAKKNNDSVKDFIFKLLLNALYGRLGIRNDGGITCVVESDVINGVISNFQYENLYEYKNHSVICLSKDGPNVIKQPIFDDTLTEKEYEVIKSLNEKVKRSELIGNKNAAVHLAAAITSKARIHVAKVLVNYSDVIYYTDTDSIFIKGKLPPSMVSPTKLGHWKHEGVIDEAIFSAPKSYGYRLKSGEVIIKSKGALKKEVDWEMLKNEYDKNNNKNKVVDGVSVSESVINVLFPFLRNMREFEIISSKRKFNKRISVTNKRECIYDSSGKWVDTKPLDVDSIDKIQIVNLNRNRNRK